MRNIAADFDSFTPLFDALTQRYGVVTAAVYGRIWRYCQMEDSVCRAAQETIAADLGLSRSTVIRSTSQLVNDGYLKDLTPELRNRPHILADSGKLSIVVKFGAVDKGVSESNSTVSERNSEKRDGVSERNSTVSESNSGCVTKQQRAVSERHMNQTLLRDSLRDTGKESQSHSNECHSIWNTILQQFQGQCERVFYRTYLEPISPISWDGKTLTLGAANSYVVDLLNDRFSPSIDHNLSGMTGNPDAHVEIIVRTPNG